MQLFLNKNIAGCIVTLSVSGILNSCRSKGVQGNNSDNMVHILFNNFRLNEALHWVKGSGFRLIYSVWDTSGYNEHKYLWFHLKIYGDVAVVLTRDHGPHGVQTPLEKKPQGMIWHKSPCFQLTDMRLLPKKRAFVTNSNTELLPKPLRIPKYSLFTTAYP